MEKKIKVKNASSARVVYNIPNMHIRRQFLPGTVIEVTQEEITQGLYEYGIKSMFADGVLVILEEEAAEATGLKPGQGVVDKDPATEEEIL